jgi:integrase
MPGFKFVRGKMTNMPKRRRTKGSGSIRKRGNVLWIEYYVRGVCKAESTGQNNREYAAKLLQQRIGEAATGRNIGPEKATVGDLCKLVIADAELRRLRDAKRPRWLYEAHIAPLLGQVRADRFGPSQVRAYVETRRQAGAEDSTINRELAIVRRGFVLGYREEPPLVRRVPAFPKLQENEPRRGFIEQAQYEAILNAIPDRLKALFVCGYHLGCRLLELRKLQWAEVDLDAREIRILAANAKNGEARTVPIYGEMDAWLATQRAAYGSSLGYSTEGSGDRSAHTWMGGAKHASGLVFQVCSSMI